MKKLVALLLGIMAVLAGAGIAIAQNGSDEPVDVPTAAHECPHGPGGVHGECVANLHHLHDAGCVGSQDPTAAQHPRGMRYDPPRFG